MLYKGLIIDSHCTKDAASKDAAGKSFKGWQQKEQTASDWIHELELGKTIVLAEMESKEDGSWTHGSDNFIRTFFVFADADHIKGVEIDRKTGEDANPKGVEPWTHDTGLSELYPNLKNQVYAVGQSVNSMQKKPYHRRYRIIFKFDEPIETAEHYKQILEELFVAYPIISPKKRSPGQPVFGNFRQGYNRFNICGNTLKLSAYPYVQPKTKSTSKAYSDKIDLSVLEYVDGNNYDDWLMVGMALYNEGEPCSVWDHWSSRSDKYEAGKCQEKWDTFGKSASQVRWGTVVQMAKERGYQTQKHYVTDPPEAIPEPVREPEIETADIPFPSAVLKNTLFGIYEKMYQGKNETCPAFRFAELSTVLGAVLGRKVGLAEGRETLYPNLYSCLVGKAGIARKSTSVFAAAKMIERLDVDLLETMYDLATVEGLLDKFRDLEDLRMLCIVDEFKWVFAKSKQRTSEGLFARLNTLFNSPEIETHTTKGDPITAIRPNFSFMTSITPAWFFENMTHSHVHGGVVSRFAFFLHEQQPFLSDSEVQRPEYDDIKAVDNYLETSANFEGKILLTYADDVREADKEMYHQRMQKISEVDEVIGTAIIRTDVYVKKFMILLSWAENSDADKIELPIFEAAHAIGEYLIKVNERLFGNLAVDKFTEQELRVLKHLDALGGSATKSELSRKIGSQHLSSRDLMRILEALVQNEKIGLFKEGNATKVIRIN